MTGDELAFWLMMGFSCSIGVLIGYLLFAPARGASRSADREEFFEEERFVDVDEDALGPDTDIIDEPYLTDPRQAREVVRRHAVEQLAAKRKRTASQSTSQSTSQPTSRSAAQAANAAASDAASAANEALASKHMPFFEPDTLRTLDAAKRRHASAKRAGSARAAPVHRANDGKGASSDQTDRTAQSDRDTAQSGRGEKIV